MHFLQLPQGPAAEQGRQQQPVGLQDMAQLQERAGQVVGPVQAERAHDQVEAAGAERQRLGLADQAHAVLAGEAPGRVERDDVGRLPGLGQQFGQAAVAGTQVQHPDEAMAHVVQSVGQPFLHGTVQEARIGREQRRALAMTAHGGAVEDDDVVAHDGGLWTGRSPAAKLAAMNTDETATPTWLAGARRRLAGAGRMALDALLPPRCLACGGAVETQGTLCATCWQAISFLGAPCCQVCGLPFPYDAGAGVRMRAMRGLPAAVRPCPRRLRL